MNRGCVIGLGCRCVVGLVTKEDMGRLTDEELMWIIIEGKPQLVGPVLTLDAITDEQLEAIAGE